MKKLIIALLAATVPLKAQTTGTGDVILGYKWSDSLGTNLVISADWSKQTIFFGLELKDLTVTNKNFGAVKIYETYVTNTFNLLNQIQRKIDFVRIEKHTYLKFNTPQSNTVTQLLHKELVNIEKRHYRIQTNWILEKVE
jgi:hypothetical protein